MPDPQIANWMRQPCPSRMGTVERAASLKEVEDISHRPAAKGVLWDRGPHALEGEMERWTARQVSDDLDDGHRNELYEKIYARSPEENARRSRGQPPRKKRRAADKAALAGSRHRTTIKSGFETAKFGRRSTSRGCEWG